MNIKKYKKIILVIILILVIAGTIIKLTKGMNYALKWKQNCEIAVHAQKTITENEINQIIKEIFPDRNTKIQYLDETDSQVLITLDTNEITEEEQNLLIQKINEKFEEELTIGNLEIIKNDQVKLTDIVKPYIIPIIISLVIIVAYFIIRYKQIKITKTIEYLIEGIVLPEWVYFSILAICRIPVGNFTLPIAMFIFLISILVLIYTFDIEYKKVLAQNNKRRK